MLLREVADARCGKGRGSTAVESMHAEGEPAIQCKVMWVRKDCLSLSPIGENFPSSSSLSSSEPFLGEGRKRKGNTYSMHEFSRQL